MTGHTVTDEVADAVITDDLALPSARSTADVAATGVTMSQVTWQ